MEVKFDLGLIKNPFNTEEKRRLRFFFEFSFGGQWYRKPDEGYMAYTIECGGNRYGSLSIEEALKLYDKDSEAHALLSDMEYIMKDDVLKFVKCIPQAKKLFITRTLKKYNHLKKIEPKFHEGDWVVNKFGDLWHIDSFDKKNYQVSDGKGNYNYFPIAKQDEMHL